MDRSYCEAKVSELKAYKENLLESIPAIIGKMENFADEDIVEQHFKEAINEFRNKKFSLLGGVGIVWKFHEIMKRLVSENQNDRFNGREWLTEDEFTALIELSRIDGRILSYEKNLIDSEWKRFDGDVIITDPHYIEPDWPQSVSEDDCSIGIDFEDKGFCRSNMYGYWICATYDTDTGRRLGHFCSENDMVCVLPLDDVLKFNPSFTSHVEEPMTTTWLRDFHGEIRVAVSEEHYERCGEERVRYNVYVEGKGNINFRTERVTDLENGEVSV